MATDGRCRNGHPAGARMDGADRPRRDRGRLCKEGETAMAESVHSKLSRVRRPRVHITYDVETEGAMVQKELPFVVGVMGDFSGDSAEPLKPLKDRKFVTIDRDNFDQVMQ